MSKISELIRYQDTNDISIGQYGGLSQAKQCTEEELEKMREAQKRMYKKEMISTKAEAIIELAEKILIACSIEDRLPPACLKDAEMFYDEAENYMNEKLGELEENEE